jgi:selenophosphate synthetase-related protein
MKKDSRKKTGLPVISLVLMGIFLVGGSIMLLIQWPPGPANLDWGVWILAYFGYVYLIAAAIFYVKTDR